eukprot:COSAG01_NODE_7377_length_3230_cov_7.645800_1_plen_78_part_10
MPSISIVTSSPSRSQTEGSRAIPTPSGVPVRITVPYPRPWRLNISCQKGRGRAFKVVGQLAVRAALVLLDGADAARVR